MHFRPIYTELLAHLEKKQVTVITGMRRVGKSTALKYLLEQVKHKNHIYLDCERVEIRFLLNEPDYEGVRDALEYRGLDFSKPCLIAIDEIQLVSGLPSVIKYLYDTYGVKFLVTGSSSYYIKNTFSESLAGRKRIFEMHPLSFQEFLVFRSFWKEIFQKQAWKPFSTQWYNLAKDWYKEYIIYGGFPEVVLEKKAADKKEILLDILNSFIELDVKLLADFTAGEELFKLCKLLAARSGNKIDHTKLSSVSGISRYKIASYLQLLEQTYLIHQISPYTQNIDKEISQQKKLYFADTGLLQVLAADQLSSGQLFENAIAAQLKPLGELQYYQKKSGQEIDFIFKGNIALEVKETPLEQDKNTLRQRAASIDISKHLLIGHHPSRGEFRNFIWAGSIY
jgi:predicted AAA+ superfamily ATPase